MTERLEKLEQGQEDMITKNKESSAKLYRMMESLLNKTDVQSEQAKKDNTLVVGKLDDLEKRVITLESGSTTKGESVFIEQHKSSIAKAKYSIKMLNMRGKVPEENVKKHLETKLDLTKTTLANTGITQTYRLGKNPEKDSDPCPPVMVFFSTTEMAERILNAARSEGQNRNFKENIPEAYSTAHNEFIRIGIYLKESQGLTYRVRYEGHILQLQVKNPTTDQYHVVTAHEPSPVVNDIEGILSKIDLSCITQPPEEDKRKLTFILGDIKITTGAGPVKVPDEMLEKINEHEIKAIKDAFGIEIKKKPGNKITVTCKTREDALLLAKWTGIQERGTYSLNPMPECFIKLTWN